MSFQTALLGDMRPSFNSLSVEKIRLEYKNLIMKLQKFYGFANEGRAEVFSNKLLEMDYAPNQLSHGVETWVDTQSSFPSYSQFTAHLRPLFKRKSDFSKEAYDKLILEKCEAFRAETEKLEARCNEKFSKEQVDAWLKEYSAAIAGPDIFGLGGRIYLGIFLRDFFDAKGDIVKAIEIAKVKGELAWKQRSEDEFCQRLFFQKEEA